MKICVLLLVCAIATPALAGWIDLSASIPWPNDSIGLVDVQFFGEEGWLLGITHSSARLFHTTDGGTTFEMESLPYEPYTMHWLSRQECFLGCHNGFVLRTTNAGDSWTLVGTSGRAIYDITFPPTGDTGFVVGFNGLGDRVTAGGVIPTPTGFVTSMVCASFPLSSHQGWACGGGVIAHFVDGSWRLDQSYPYGSFSGMFFANESAGWCVGNFIMSTRDGMNWNGMPVGDTALMGVHFLDTLRGWVVGSFGYVGSTTDGGETWQHEPTSSMTDNLLMKVFAVGTGTVYVVGNNRTLLKYTNAGAIAATPSAKARTPNRGPMLVRGVLTLDSSFDIGNSSLLDASGRRVMSLRPGPNNVARLAPGVYFIRPLSPVGRGASGAIRVVVTR